jgi:hypothetical protein
MEKLPDQKQTQKPRPAFRDIWQFIIKIIIALLIIAWFFKEYMTNRELNIVTLIILIILLAFIIWLIIKQWHYVKLYCKITSPNGCTTGSTGIVTGKILEPVIGDAYGIGFSNYFMELRDPGGNLLSDVIIYPDNGGNPDTTLTQGNNSVTGGTLGWIDIEKAVQDAGIILLTSTTFEITLRVFDVYGGEKSPNCKTSFTISVNEVFIKRVSSPWSVDYMNPGEPLRRADDPAAELATIGGNMHVRGVVNVYGCTNENVDEYTIWAIPDPTFTFAQPAPLSSVTPQPDWVQVTHIKFASQTINGTVFSADDVRALNILDGSPHPDILTNVWGTRNNCHCLHIDATIICSCWKVPDLKTKSFNSKTALLPYKLDPSHVGGTGKFTFLLQVIDTSGNQYYDIQRAWIDNEKEVAVINGIGGLPSCTDLYTKTPRGAFKTVDIEGTAWDALIDPSDLTTPTSDNFDRFEITIQKQTAAAESVLFTSTSPVPARPAAVAVDVLTTWDLESLNAATNPLGLPADQLLADGESCAYNVTLRVWDHTYTNENGPGIHFAKDEFPIKIINSPEPAP